MYVYVCSVARILRSVANLIKRSANCVLRVHMYAFTHARRQHVVRLFSLPCRISHFNEMNSGDKRGFKVHLRARALSTPEFLSRVRRLFHVYHLTAHCLDRAFTTSAGNARASRDERRLEYKYALVPVRHSVIAVRTLR